MTPFNFASAVVEQETSAATRLYHPFPAVDHEFHPYFKFVYLKEEAINRRLTEVLGLTGWSKIITDRQFIPEGMPTVAIKSGNATYHIPMDKYPGAWEQDSGEYWSLISEDEGGEIRTTRGEKLEVTFDIPHVLTYGYMSVRIGDHEARRDSVGADVLTDMGKERGTRTMNTWKASDTDLLKRLARQFGVGLYLTEAKKVNEGNLADWLWKNYGPTTVAEAKMGLVKALVSDKTTQRIYSDAAALGSAIHNLGFSDDQLLYSYSVVLKQLELQGKAKQ